MGKTTTASLNLSEKGGYNQSTTLTPAGTSWQSSNTSVATVSSSGVVTAKAAGTSTVSCKANGITLGSATVTVSVEPTSSKIDIAKAQKRFRDADLVYPYNGKARRPFGLMYGGEGFFFSAQGYRYPDGGGASEAWGGPLKEGKDYTVAYSNNTNVGTAKAVFTGIGSYTGTCTFTFKIVNNPFIDVSENTGHCNDILWLADKKISEGWTVRGGKEFRPLANVARVDMAAFLWRLNILKK